VGHDVGHTRHLLSGGTSADNRGHFGPAGTISPSGIGAAS
jgi:hypothetical protein